MHHRIVQVQVIPDSPESEGYFLAVCEDGTLWNRVYLKHSEGSGPATDCRWEWQQITPPPIALERPSATEPDEDVSKEPCPQCGSKEKVQCGDPAIHECDRCYHAWEEPAAQDEELLEDMVRVFWGKYVEPGKGTTDAMKVALAVARQHFAARPVTTQVPEGYVRLEDVRAAIGVVCRHYTEYRFEHLWANILYRLAPKQKTPEEPETVDALDQLAMSLQWEQEYTDDYKRRVLREAVQFVLQGGAHERTPTP